MCIATRMVNLNCGVDVTERPQHTRIHCNILDQSVDQFQPQWLMGNKVSNAQSVMLYIVYNIFHNAELLIFESLRLQNLKGLELTSTVSPRGPAGFRP